MTGRVKQKMDPNNHNFKNSLNTILKEKLNIIERKLIHDKII